jgi:hypothetical protein
MVRLRSAEWYGGSDRNAYIHRAWMRRGLPRHAFNGRPHIAIANTASDLTSCNLHLDDVAASVKEGVWEVLVATQGETPDEAFQQLRARARSSQRRVADLAQEVVQEAQRERIAGLAINDARIRAAEARAQQAEAALQAAQTGLARRTAALDRAQDNLDERARAADERNHLADQRDQAADVRERAADHQDY